jgi:hypothetical protein
MRRDVFDAILARDPQVLLQSDVTAASTDDIAHLVERLLTLVGQEAIFDLDRQRYPALQHQALADQLRPHITTNDASLAARELAIDLAEACEVVELEDELATLALDRSAPLRSRINAAYAISRIGTERSRNRLRPLAIEHRDDDPSDELKSADRCLEAPPTEFESSIRPTPLVTQVTQTRPNPGTAIR